MGERFNGPPYGAGQINRAGRLNREGMAEESSDEEGR